MYVCEIYLPPVTIQANLNRTNKNLKFRKWTLKDVLYIYNDNAKVKVLN